MNRKSLKFLYANARSIMKAGKLDELKCILQSLHETIQIIVISETWIKSEEDVKTAQIPEYTHYYNHRYDSKGGGVSIFTHNTLKHSLVEEKTVDDNHYLWIHIDKFSLDIGAIYKPGRTNSISFLEEYTSQLEKQKRAVVFGDFNYDLLSHEKSADYKYAMEESGFNILNKIDPLYITRETDSTKSILDHVCTNVNNNKFHFAIIESNLSDHKHIYLEIDKHIPAAIKSTQYEAINYDKLLETVKGVDFNNTDAEYTKLEEILTSCVSKCKFTKTKKLNPPRQDWINQNIMDMINKRNELGLMNRKYPKDKSIQEALIKERKEVTSQIQKTKATYYHNALKNCVNKPAKMWTLINSLYLNKVKDSNTTSPNKLVSDNGIITDEKEMCEFFNDYFSTIGETLANEIPQKYHKDNIFNAASRPPNPDLHDLSNFTPASTEEVGKIIDNLKSNTASGIDGLTVRTIKCLKNLILENLTNSINKCLELGLFPDSLKIAKVTPIFKTGKKTDPSNYRPISVLPTMSKIFEKVLYNRLESYLATKNIISSKQYGFRPKSNTLSATVDIITKIKTNIDQKQIAMGVFIDLKKAFDTVSHKILLKKLNSIGITGTALSMFKSYLSNRRQVVRIGNQHSQAKSITYGVPQGSILGPLLFLIYINNIHEIGLKGDVTLYADDTSLFYFGNSVDSVISDAQSDLDLLNQWFQFNLLTINVLKTNYIIFKAKNKKIDNHQPLKINGKPISKTNQQIYLGLLLDNQLTWKPHLEKIKSKLSSLTGALRVIVKCLPKNTRYCIYNALVKPHIDYLIQIWGTAAKSHLDVIQRAQNKLVKVLFHYPFLTSTKKIYKETNLLNITQSYIYFTCLLIRKILTNDIHSEIKFTKKRQIHKMTLRSANDIVLRAPRTNYGKKTILFEGGQLYNKLPKNIKEAKSMYSFKKLLKQYISNNF